MEDEPSNEETEVIIDGDAVIVDGQKVPIVQTLKALTTLITLWKPSGHVSDDYHEERMPIASPAYQAVTTFVEALASALEKQQEHAASPIEHFTVGNKTYRLTGMWSTVRFHVRRTGDKRHYPYKEEEGHFPDRQLEMCRGASEEECDHVLKYGPPNELRGFILVFRNEHYLVFLKFDKERGWIKYQPDEGKLTPGKHFFVQTADEES
ncbi:MAG: hypothetical protein PHC70_02430 [Patescibacteria group bacterium]|nr:hypothetical protein [Patescibacteria group bacterium]